MRFSAFVCFCDFSSTAMLKKGICMRRFSAFCYFDDGCFQQRHPNAFVLDHKRRYNIISHLRAESKQCDDGSSVRVRESSERGVKSPEWKGWVKRYTEYLMGCFFAFVGFGVQGKIEWNQRQNLRTIVDFYTIVRRGLSERIKINAQEARVTETISPEQKMSLLQTKKDEKAKKRVMMRQEDDDSIIIDEGEEDKAQKRDSTLVQKKGKNKRSFLETLIQWKDETWAQERMEDTAKERNSVGSIYLTLI